MRDSVLSFFAKGANRDTVERIAGDLHVLLAQYMRALVLLGFVASVAYGVFFTLLGVPYAILLAAVTFPLEFIPMVGPLAGATIALLVVGLSGSHHLLVVVRVSPRIPLFSGLRCVPALFERRYETAPVAGDLWSPGGRLDRGHCRAVFFRFRCSRPCELSTDNYSTKRHLRSLRLTARLLGKDFRLPKALGTGLRLQQPFLSVFE